MVGCVILFIIVVVVVVYLMCVCVFIILPISSICFVLKAFHGQYYVFVMACNEFY
jgi:hypothetical protein